MQILEPHVSLDVTNIDASVAFCRRPGSAADGTR